MNSNNKRLAFEEYYRLIKTGIKTTSAVKRVADKYDVSVRQVYTWKKENHWDKEATERSVKATEELKEEIMGKTDREVKDYRKTFISLLTNLVGRCAAEKEVKIHTVNELIKTIECVDQLQKELEIGTTHIVSSSYDRQEHVKEINGLLGQLKRRDIKKTEQEKVKQEKKEALKNESGLHEIKV